MKKFLIALVIFLQGATAFAAVEKHTDNGTNYKISYPIVYTSNKAAQDKINQNIYPYIAAFRNDFQAGKFYEGHFSYTVKFENNDYVSLTITDYRFNLGAAHGYYNVYGLVYDKKTGRKLPLSNFLKITLNDLQYFLHGHLYNESGQQISGFGEPREVSQEYFLLGGGGIALIYQPYALASYADGATTIRLSAEDVDYFNRKNRNL